MSTASFTGTLRRPRLASGLTSCPQPLCVPCYLTTDMSCSSIACASGYPRRCHPPSEGKTKRQRRRLPCRVHGGTGWRLSRKKHPWAQLITRRDEKSHDLPPICVDRSLGTIFSGELPRDSKTGYRSILLTPVNKNKLAVER